MDSERILPEQRFGRDVRSQEEGEKTSTLERCEDPKCGVDKELTVPLGTEQAGTLGEDTAGTRHRAQAAWLRGEVLVPRESRCALH